MFCDVLRSFILAAFVFMSAVSVNAATYWLPDYQDGHSLGKPSISDNSNQENSCTKFNMLSAVPNGAVCDTAYPGKGLRCYRNCRCKSEFTYTSHTQNLKCSDSCTLNGITKYKCLKCCNDGYIYKENSVAPSCGTNASLTETNALNSSCGSGKCFKCLNDACPAGYAKLQDCLNGGNVPFSDTRKTDAGTVCYQCGCGSGLYACEAGKCPGGGTAYSTVSYNGKSYTCCTKSCSVCKSGETQCPGTTVCVNKNNNGCCSDSDCSGGESCDISTRTCKLMCGSGYSKEKPSCASGQTLCTQPDNSSCWGCCGTACGNGYSTSLSSCSGAQILVTQGTNTNCKKCVSCENAGKKTCGNRCIDTGQCCVNGSEGCTGSQKCVDGRCVNKSCKELGKKDCNGTCIATTECCGCSSTQKCVSGDCVDKSCSELGKKDCNGTCIATTECCGGCGSTQKCVNGSCVDKSCAELGKKDCNGTCIATTECCGCSSTQKCVSGSCEDMSCKELGKKDCNGTCIATTECCGGCSSSQKCVNGSCVNVGCPTGSAALGKCTSNYGLQVNATTMNGVAGCYPCVSCSTVGLLDPSTRASQPNTSVCEAVNYNENPGRQGVCYRCKEGCPSNSASSSSGCASGFELSSTLAKTLSDGTKCYACQAKAECPSGTYKNTCPTGFIKVTNASKLADGTQCVVCTKSGSSGNGSCPASCNSGYTKCPTDRTPATGAVTVQNTATCCWKLMNASKCGTRYKSSGYICDCSI